MRRPIVTLSLVAATLALANSAAAQETKVAIGLSGWTGFAPLTLAYNSTSLYYSNCIERTFPRGLDFEIFRFDMLKEAYEKAASDTQKEHVTPYFYQNHQNKFTLKHYKAAVDNSHFRITVDTPEDFELIKILIEQYHAATK